MVILRHEGFDEENLCFQAFVKSIIEEADPNFQNSFSSWSHSYVAESTSPEPVVGYIECKEHGVVDETPCPICCEYGFEEDSSSIFLGIKIPSPCVRCGRIVEHFFEYVGISPPPLQRVCHCCVELIGNYEKNPTPPSEWDERIHKNLREYLEDSSAWFGDVPPEEGWCIDDLEDPNVFFECDGIYRSNGRVLHSQISSMIARGGYKSGKLP